MHIVYSLDFLLSLLKNTRTKSFHYKMHTTPTIESSLLPLFSFAKNCYWEDFFKKQFEMGFLIGFFESGENFFSLISKKVLAINHIHKKNFEMGPRN